MTAVLNSITSGFSNLVSRFTGPKRESYNSPLSPIGYRKKEYYSAPETNTNNTNSMYSFLPAINPRVLFAKRGLVDNEVMTGTSGSWDPRGEVDSVKRIQSVMIPGQLVNERALTAAQQRAENRDFTGDRTIQL
jgi:hypothetical protein